MRLGTRILVGLLGLMTVRCGGNMPQRDMSPAGGDGGDPAPNTVTKWIRDFLQPLQNLIRFETTISGNVYGSRYTIQPETLKLINPEGCHKDNNGKMVDCTKASFEGVAQLDLHPTSTKPDEGLPDMKGQSKVDDETRLRQSGSAEDSSGNSFAVDANGIPHGFNLYLSGTVSQKDGLQLNIISFLKYDRDGKIIPASYALSMPLYPQENGFEPNLSLTGRYDNELGTHLRTPDKTGYVAQFPAPTIANATDQNGRLIREMSASVCGGGSCRPLMSVPDDGGLDSGTNADMMTNTAVTVPLDSLNIFIQPKP